MNTGDSLSWDASVPPAIADKTEQVGIRKDNAGFLTLVTSCLAICCRWRSATSSAEPWW